MSEHRDNGFLDRCRFSAALVLGRLLDSNACSCALAAACAGLSRAGLGRVAVALQFLVYNIAGLASSRLLATPEDTLHTYRFRLRVRRALRGLTCAPKRQPRENPTVLRVGMVGEMSCGGARPTSLITDFPEDHEFVAFDTGWNGVFNDLQHGDNVRLVRHNLVWGDDTSLRALANAINREELDAVIVANYDDGLKDDLVQLLDAPCIINFIMGEWPLGNPRVDYTLYPIKRLELTFRGSRIYSEITRRLDPTERFYIPHCHCFENCEASVAGQPPVASREPVMVFHGNLCKLYSPSHLDMLCELLAEDPALRFLYIGQGPQQPLIQAYFRARGLDNQLIYHGFIDRVRLSRQEYYQKLFSTLSTCRLAPSPWPQGGGLARLEAYLAGVPTVHMRLQRGGRLWRRGDMPLTDVPCLEVPSATAASIQEYKELCRRCLYDDDFARTVQLEQYAIARNVTDSRRWWQDTLESYRQWAAGSGWAKEQAQC